MGAEEKTPQSGKANVAPTEAITATEVVAPPTVPPPEEPPKVEEIVTEDVLQEIIKGYNSELSLVSWQAQPGSKIGDNYMSIMYALELVLEDKRKNGARQTLQVMLKTLPRNVFRQDMINEMQAFEKEAIIYQKIFPMFIQHQEETQIARDDVFSAWPLCYAAHIDGTTDYLAMENLKDSGYVMGNRKQGLNFNHCASVLRSLARYHAISFVKYGGCRDKILEVFPDLNHRMFNKENKMAAMQQSFYSQSFISQAAIFREVGGEELAASRLDKLATVNFCDFMEPLLSKDVKCAVILHGDCWLNNMMFKYSDKDEKLDCPAHVKFIDFQLCNASSRLVDFYYFLYTSANLETLVEREQDLLMTYYSEFTSFAQKLGANTKEAGLTWDNFMKETEQYRTYGVLMGLLLAPMMTADAEDIPDMETFTHEDFENADETIKKFNKDLNKGYPIQKAKHILLTELPKCINGQQYL